MCRRAGVLQVHAPAHPALTCSRCSHLDTASAGDSCRLSPGKSLFSLDTDQVTDMFGGSEPARKGRGEQRGREAASIHVLWPRGQRTFVFDGHLGGHHVISLLLFPECPKPLALSSREPPPEPRKFSLSRIPVPRRAELSVSISTLGIGVYLMTNFTYSLVEK